VSIFCENPEKKDIKKAIKNRIAARFRLNIGRDMVFIEKIVRLKMSKKVRKTTTIDFKWCLTKLVCRVFQNVKPCVEYFKDSKIITQIFSFSTFFQQRNEK
jgi:hypothetical protein